MDGRAGAEIEAFSAFTSGRGGLPFGLLSPSSALLQLILLPRRACHLGAAFVSLLVTRPPIQNLRLEGRGSASKWVRPVFTDWLSS